MRFNFLRRSVSSIRTHARRITYRAISLLSDKLESTLRAIQIESVRLYTENSLARALIDILVTNVIGSGLEPTISLDNVKGITNPDELEKEIIQKWEIWSKSTDSDYSQITDFLDLQSQAYFSQILLGEVFSIQRIKDGKLSVQLIESSRIGYSGNKSGFINSGKGNGIEYSLQGKELKFNIDEGLIIDAKAGDGRKQVIHLFKQKSPGQMRGVGMLAPVQSDFKDLGQYKSYEIKGAIIAASMTAFITSPKKDPLGNSPLNAQAKIEDPKYDDNKDYAFAPGAIIALDPEEKIEMPNNSRPGASFSGFYDTVVRDIGAGIGVPFNILVKKFDTAYTAARAAVLEFWKTVMVDRSLFSRRFCQEIFSQWLTLEVITKRIDIPGYLENEQLKKSVLNATRWIGSAMPQIDEVKSVNAAKGRITLGLSNREMESKKIGNGDWNQISDKLLKEDAKLKVIDNE